MDYKDAAVMKMPFGKHKGKTLDDIAVNDSGLLYLDWLRGEREKNSEKNSEPIDIAIRSYLDNESIAKDLAEITPDDPHKDH